MLHAFDVVFQLGSIDPIALEPTVTTSGSTVRAAPGAVLASVPVTAGGTRLGSASISVCGTTICVETSAWELGSQVPTSAVTTGSWIDESIVPSVGSCVTWRSRRTVESPTWFVGQIVMAPPGTPWRLTASSPIAAHVPVSDSAAGWPVHVIAVEPPPVPVPVVPVVPDVVELAELVPPVPPVPLVLLPPLPPQPAAAASVKSAGKAARRARSLARMFRMAFIQSYRSVWTCLRSTPSSLRSIPRTVETILSSPQTYTWGPPAAGGATPA